MSPGKKITVDGKVEMTVPVSFAEPVLDKKEWKITNTDQRIMITYGFVSVNAADTTDDNDITEWTDKQLSALKADTRAKYIDDGIFLQDGKNIGYIKSKADPAEGPDNYRILFFMAVDGRVFQCLFTCPEKLRKKWEPVADEIANSLRIIKPD